MSFNSKPFFFRFSLYFSRVCIPNSYYREVSVLCHVRNQLFRRRKKKFHLMPCFKRVMLEANCLHCIFVLQLTAIDLANKILIVRYKKKWFILWLKCLLLLLFICFIWSELFGIWQRISSFFYHTLVYILLYTHNFFSILTTENR